MSRNSARIFCSRHRIRACFILLISGLLVGLSTIRADASSAIFGGGPFYSGGTATMNALRSSGYSTVMLWCIHVDATTGDLIYNDQRIVSGGAYVGNSAWPSQLATLKTAPTSVSRIEVSVSSWGVNDFQAIQQLMNNYGTNTTSILYKNFKALKTATGADAIDYDDETLYDVTTAVKFGQMLAGMGYKVTLCPYSMPSFWQGVYNQLGRNIVDAIYLQCYAGGGGNDPATWNSYFSGIKVQPGMWCRNGAGCASGNTAAEVQSQMTTWRSSAGIPGGFMWLYDDMLSCTSGGTASDYARAINIATDPLLLSTTTGFSAVAAYNSNFVAARTTLVLSNTGSLPINWGIVNTSAWISVSLTNGTLAANGSATVNISLKPDYATNLAFGAYSANVLVVNSNGNTTRPILFRLNTGIANWPIAVTGFNAGVIASNNATAAKPGATGFDIPNTYSFYQSGLPGTTRGFPLNGAFPSLCDNSVAFQLAPYGASNALMLGYTYSSSGTLTLATPKAFNTLAVLASSANGGGQGTFAINFTDGSKSPTFSFNAQDWFFNTANVAVQGFGRLKLGTSFGAEDNGDLNPNLYQTTINLSALGLTQPVQSVTFYKPANSGASQTTAIFGLSGMDTTVPVRAPVGLTAIPGSNATVRLAWNAAGGAANYNVRYAVHAVGDPVPAGTAAGTNLTVGGLNNGVTYDFTVSSLGVTGESAPSAPVSAMPGSYKGWALSWNPVAWWPLNEAGGSSAADIIGGNNGSYAGTTALANGFYGAGFQVPHRATRFDGSTACAQIPLIIGNTNFTIAFWVLTTAVGSTGQWYNGKGLVDGEVTGSTNDFGIALVGGKVGFGVGNPDTTVTSSRSVNNNVWHQVVATRDARTGAMKLYIDGILDGSGTGPVGSRTASPYLRIGSLQTGANFLAGTISDVIAYNQVLSSDQIATLYSAATGLFYNVRVTSTWDGSTYVLNWLGNGKLLESTNIVGPWTTNSLGSPLYITPDTPQKFYRVQTR